MNRRGFLFGLLAAPVLALTARFGLGYGIVAVVEPVAGPCLAATLECVGPINAC